MTYNYEKGNSGTRKLTFDPEQKGIRIGAMEGNYTSKISKVCLLLHGFEGLKDSLKMDGATPGCEDATIDLYTALGENDPLYPGGRKYPQQVKKCVFSLASGRDTLVTW